MAEVYLARHGELSGFKTLVVVKKVLPHLAENPEFISMFLDEARIASLLDHPNVVRIVEVGRAESDYFLAMELVQGKPLASLIRRAAERPIPLDPKLAALIMAQAAAGLHHAHGVSDAEGHPLGLVHRDVSPKNILVSFEGGVKIREEVQTGVESFELAIQLFGSLDYKPVFRYQKFREVWRVKDVEVVLDRTPIGDYFEIEGQMDVIRSVAEELGLNMEQGIRQTYADLYRQHRRTRADLGENMVFPPEALPGGSS